MRWIPATLSDGLFGIAFLGLVGAAPNAEAAELHSCYLTKGRDYILEAGRRARNMGWRPRVNCMGYTVGFDPD